MKYSILTAAAFLAATTGAAAQSSDEITQYDGYNLVWHDEFDKDGQPDPEVWVPEVGFKRNHEDQWYQGDNAFCENGKLVIEARKERKKNPNYDPNSSDWTKNREYAEWTSSCLTTDEKKSWLYGRFEVYAKLPCLTGTWPAIWFLGQNDEAKKEIVNGKEQTVDYSWPNNGEIDVLEFYQTGSPRRAHILANACWGGAKSKWDATWNSKRIPYAEHFLAKDPEWASKFHLWRMDWDEEAIRIYLDGELLNEIKLETTVNPQRSWFRKGDYNPFKQPQYMLLNMALGGDNGGSLANLPDKTRYEIDYVRVYQKKGQTDGVTDIADNGGITVRGNGDSIEVTGSTDLADCHIDVVGAAGNLVYSTTATFDGTASLTLPCSLPQGLYVVKVKHGNGVVAKKVLVDGVA